MSEVPVDSSAQLYLKSKQKKKGSVKDLKKAAQEHLITLPYTEYFDYHTQKYRQLPKHWSSLFSDLYFDWLYTLIGGYNVLVFGAADHSNILSEFHTEYLKGEDVIECTGNPFPTHSSHSSDLAELSWARCIRNIMSHITSKVLKTNDFLIPEDSTCLPMACRHLCDLLERHYGYTNETSTDASSSSRRIQQSSTLVKYSIGRYAHNQTRLFIVIHELCGPILADSNAYSCLSILASSKAVAMICSVRCTNVVTLWSPIVVTQFNWKYYHFGPHENQHIQTLTTSLLPRDHVIFHAGKSHSGVGSLGIIGTDVLLTVLHSVDANARELLCMICREGGAITGVKLLDLAGKKLIAKFREDLMLKLKELIDHNVVTLTRQGSFEIFRAMLSEEDIAWVAGEQQTANQEPEPKTQQNNKKRDVNETNNPTAKDTKRKK
jgi:hypothetical protein